MLGVALNKNDLSESGFGFLRGFERMMLNMETTTLQDRQRIISIFKDLAGLANCEVAKKLDETIMEYVQHRIDDPSNHGVPFKLEGKSQAEFENEDLKKLNERLQRERDQALDAVKPGGEKVAWEIYTYNLRHQNSNLYDALEGVEERLARETDKNTVLARANVALVSQLAELGVKPRVSSDEPNVRA